MSQPFKMTQELAEKIEEVKYYVSPSQISSHATPMWKLVKDAEKLYADQEYFLSQIAHKQKELDQLNMNLKKSETDLSSFEHLLDKVYGSEYIYQFINRVINQKRTNDVEKESQSDKLPKGEEIIIDGIND